MCRKFAGTSSISLLDKVPPILLLDRSTSGAAPVTVRVSATPESRSEKSTIRSDPEVNARSGRVNAANPGMSTARD